VTQPDSVAPVDVTLPTSMRTLLPEELMMRALVAVMLLPAGAGGRCVCRYSGQQMYLSEQCHMYSVCCRCV
jgi:hypothetical protein